MKPITADYTLAMAAGLDAAKRSMRRAGRSVLSEEDWNIGTLTMAKIIQLPIDPPDPYPNDLEPICPYCMDTPCHCGEPEESNEKQN